MKACSLRSLSSANIRIFGWPTQNRQEIRCPNAQRCADDDLD
jgi:hypothetical protein